MFTSSDFAAVVDVVLTTPPRLGQVRLVAVDGPSGSGKSTYAAGLTAAFTAALERVVPSSPLHGGPPAGNLVPEGLDLSNPVGVGLAPENPTSESPALGSPGAGGPGAGSAVAGPAGVALVSTDDFATWDDPVAWWPRLVDGVLGPLADGRPGRYRRTEWTDGVPHPGVEVTIATPRVLVLEGVSAGRRSVASYLSALVWLELPRAERLERAVARDGESSRESLTTWQNFESGWFAVDGAARRATHRPSTGSRMSADRTSR